MAVDRKTEQQLALDQIQGDVLMGLQKDHEVFLGFHISQIPPFKTFLQHLTSEITTGKKVFERELQLQALKVAGSKIRLSLIGVNIGFTFSGLQALGVQQLDMIKDLSFTAGLAARSADLGDPIAGEGAPANWKLGKDISLHGLVLITGPDHQSVAAKVADLKSKAGTSWMVTFEEEGMTRPLDRGHEHFGYLDGVSQPALRGRIDHLFPGHVFLQDSLNPGDPNQGLPGADLHWPGEFVFGYAGQKADEVEEPDAPSDGGLPWMRNGTFMVYRRLKQLVPEFDSFVDATAEALDMDPALLGARMVGRWKSGAPVSLSPLQDNPPQGGDEMQNNDFEFDDDSAARRCPYAGHIRKSYPRNDITPAGAGLPTDFERREASEADTQTHRIMRRGIPFGDDVTEAEAKQEKTLQDRGLMFVCYQTSVIDQFEFIIENWVNNRDFAVANAGHDPILGQGVGANRMRDFTGATVTYPNGPPGPPIQLPADFIIPTGGGYFFVPSISALKTVLAV